MNKLKTLTPKQKQLFIRKRHLISFRRFLSLSGSGDAVYDYLDMNAFELRHYIESKWQTGMSWDNYRIDWCVDHIVGLKYFNVFNISEMRLCWSYNNLTPCWISDNHAKGYCLEVTKKQLIGLKQNSTTILLLRHINKSSKMFDPYYK